MEGLLSTGPTPSSFLFKLLSLWIFRGKIVVFFKGSLKSKFSLAKKKTCININIVHVMPGPCRLT